MNAAINAIARTLAPRPGPGPAPQPDLISLNSVVAQTDCEGQKRGALAGYNRLQRVTRAVTKIYQHNQKLKARGYRLQPATLLDAYTRARVRVSLCNSVTL